MPRRLLAQHSTAGRSCRPPLRRTAFLFAGTGSRVRSRCWIILKQAVEGVESARLSSQDNRMVARIGFEPAPQRVVGAVADLVEVEGERSAIETADHRLDRADR